MIESEDLSSKAFGRCLIHFIYKAQGKYDQAEKEAALAIDIAEAAKQPRWKDFFRQALIAMHINIGILSEAREILDRELKRLEDAELPLDSGWIYYKTWVEARMKSFAEAKKALGELKVLIDKNIQDAGNLKFIRYHDWLKGVINLEQNNLSEAVAELEKAVSMFSVPSITGNGGMDAFAISFIDYADCLNPLARAYFESGDLEKARQEYEKIIGQSAGGGSLTPP